MRKLFDFAQHDSKDLDEPVVTWHTWYGLDEAMVAAFTWRYTNLLAEFDGSVVTHSPVFCRLFVGFGKPVFVVNSCRYDAPYCWSDDREQLAELNSCLQRMQKNGQLVAVSNNKADQEYLYLGAGIESRHIPSLCMYTGVRYDAEESKDRPAILFTKTCNIPREYRNKLTASADISCPDMAQFEPSQDPIAAIMEKKEHIQPLSHHRPGSGSSWASLFNHRAAGHFIYEMSTMAIFEQYAAGVPLVFPSQRFCAELIGSKRMPIASRYWLPPSAYAIPVQASKQPKEWGHPDRAIVDLARKFEHTLHPTAVKTFRDGCEGFFVENKFIFGAKQRGYPDALKICHDEETYLDWWLSRADIYDEDWMPGVRFFDSWEELLEKLGERPDVEQSRQHLASLERRRERILKLWRQAIEEKFPSLQGL